MVALFLASDDSNFDFIGVSFRGRDSDAFQNYFIDMASRSELVRLRAARTSVKVDLRRNGAVLSPAASDLPKDSTFAQSAQYH
jgi:hypothetical protein